MGMESTAAAYFLSCMWFPFRPVVVTFPEVELIRHSLLSCRAVRCLSWAAGGFTLPPNKIRSERGANMALTEQQMLAIKAIADGADNKRAAEISGLGEKYISTLKSQADFSHALALCCVDRLKGLLPESISKLGEIIRAPGRDLYPTQVQAVKTVLEYSRIADLVQTVPDNVTVTIKYE